MHRMKTLYTALLLALCAAAVGMGGVASGAEVAPSVQESKSGLSGYSAVVAALTQGRDVKMMAKLGECVTAQGEVGPDVIGGVRVDSFMIRQNSFVAFSDVHPTLGPQNVPVTEYVRYRLTPDSVVSLVATTLASDGKVISQADLSCRVGKGAVFYLGGR